MNAEGNAMKGGLRAAGVFYRVCFCIPPRVGAGRASACVRAMGVQPQLVVVLRGVVEDHVAR